MELKPEQNYKIICKSIVANEKIEEEIISFKKKLDNIEKIEVLRFIRWCKSAKNIYEEQEKLEYKSLLYKNNIINYKYIVGISGLRSIIDRFDSSQRQDNIKNYFEDDLPEKLFKLLTPDFEKELEELKKSEKLEEFPFEFKKVENKKYISSKFSGITLEFPETENPNINSINNIKWTKSAIDIADAIITALISKTILVLEGPPGRRKTAILKAVYNYLNIEDENLKRINFSPSTTIEDVFSRIIPKIDEEKVSTQRKEQGLLSILKYRKNSINYYKQGLILDEINLSSDVLLEYL